MPKHTSVRVARETNDRLKKAILRKVNTHGRVLSADEHINELQDLEDGRKRRVPVRTLKGV